METDRPFRIVTLLSGRGSNFEAILRYAENSFPQVRFAAVVSDKKNARGLQLAKNDSFFSDIETEHCPRRAGKLTREQFDQALVDVIEPYEPDLIVLAGFMRVIASGLINRFNGNVVNIHPSLLPKYPGLDTHKRALEAGDSQAGCTVHYVSEEVDAGPIIAQGSVPVEPSDSPETLAARVLLTEHQIFPAVIHAIVEGAVKREMTDDLDRTIYSKDVENFIPTDFLPKR